MAVLIKDNREISVPDDKTKELLEHGWSAVDEKGNIIKKTDDSKEKLLGENSALKSENRALKKELKELKSAAGGE